GYEIYIAENARSDERVFGREHVDDEQIKPEHRQDQLGDDFGRAEPVELVAAVEHELERAEAEADHGEAGPVEAELRILSTVLHEQPQARHGEQAERQVDVEHPAPIVDVGQIAAQRGPEYRSDHDAHPPPGHG